MYTMNVRVRSGPTSSALVFLALAAFGLLLSSGPEAALPSSPREKGLEIARKVFNRNAGKDSKAECTMVLFGKGGRKRIRRFTALYLDEGSVRYTLIRFTSPKDIKGTSFLNISRADGTNVQYLYLPALRRARRISGALKGRRFVNSDFTYEDLERRDPERDEHTLKGESSLEGRPLWILESRPKPDSGSQYGLIRWWIDKAALLPVKAEFYDKRGRLIKRYTASGLEKIQGIWTAREALMEDLRKGSSTLIRIEEIRYDQGLKRDLFEVRSLGRR